LAEAKGPNVFNEHERVLPGSPETVGAMLNALGSPDDALWPADRWPAMELDKPLQVGARGGHGPIRYYVVEYEPGKAVEFRFSGPPGFAGGHEFLVERADLDGQPAARLRHVVALRPEGDARYKWPLVYRPLHDALMEDLLDRAEATLRGQPVPASRWSWYVRLLRSLLKGRS
ncbi:MAG TPA: hypothetical protein VF832_04400, partial [Longimicrobiales bacterium]